MVVFASQLDLASPPSPSHKPFSDSLVLYSNSAEALTATAPATTPEPQTAARPDFIYFDDADTNHDMKVEWLELYNAIRAKYNKDGDWRISDNVKPA